MKKVNKQENQNNIAQFIGNNNKVEQNNYINPVTIDSNFLLDITKKQHKLYPYFFTGMDKLPNGKFGYKSIPASKEAEIKFPLSIQSNVTVIDEKYKGYTDLDKILKESYNNQEPIKVKVNSTIQKLGDEIDPYQPFEGEEIVEAYILPQKFPNVPIISIGFTNSDFIVDGIQLEIVKKEGDNITYLNNKKQDCFISVEMKVTVSNVNKEKQCADTKFNFNFNINERYKENLDANITFYKILLHIAEGYEMYIKFIDKPNKSIIGKLQTTKEITALKNAIRFCEILKKINTTFNLNLSQSLDYSEDDYDSINFLEKILLSKNKYEKEIVLKVDTSKVEEKNILKLLDTDNDNITEVRKNVQVPLLNTNLHISKIAKIYSNYTIKNKKEIMTDMKSCIKEGILDIILIPKKDYINVETRYTI